MLDTNQEITRGLEYRYENTKHTSQNAHPHILNPGFETHCTHGVMLKWVTSERPYMRCVDSQTFVRSPDDIVASDSQIHTQTQERLDFFSIAFLQAAGYGIAPNPFHCKAWLWLGRPAPSKKRMPVRWNHACNAPHRAHEQHLCVCEESGASRSGPPSTLSVLQPGLLLLPKHSSPMALDYANAATALPVGKPTSGPIGRAGRGCSCLRARVNSSSGVTFMIKTR